METKTMVKNCTHEQIEDHYDAIGQRLHTTFCELRGEMKVGFARIDARFDQADARFAAFQRTLLQLGGVIIAALLGLIATQL